MIVCSLLQRGLWLVLLAAAFAHVAGQKASELGPACEERADALTASVMQW